MSTNQQSEQHKFFKIVDNGKVVGRYGISIYDDIKAVGIGSLLIYPQFRGRGYATRAIRRIVNRYKGDYDLIYCFVDADNIPAIRLYKKIGNVLDNCGPNRNGQYEVEFWNKNKQQ